MKGKHDDYYAALFQHDADLRPEDMPFSTACQSLCIGGTLSCIGIPPGKVFLETPISSIVIKGLYITGNLVGSLKECLEAVELVRRGVVKPKISVRPFKELENVYEELERGDVAGRIVLKIGGE